MHGISGILTLKSCSGLFGFISTAGYLLPSLDAVTRRGPCFTESQKRQAYLAEKKYLLGSLVLAILEFDGHSVFYCLARTKQPIDSEIFSILPSFLFILRAERRNFLHEVNSDKFAVRGKEILQLLA